MGKMKRLLPPAPELFLNVSPAVERELQRIAFFA